MRDAALAISPIVSRVELDCSQIEFDVNNANAQIINGEVYDVDDTLLAWMDAFEGHPEVYERDQITVQLSDGTHPASSVPAARPNGDGGVNSACDIDDDVDGSATVGGRNKEDINDNRVKLSHADGRGVSKAVADDDGSRSASQTCSCWVYFLKRYPPGLERLTCYGTYDAFGIPGKEYGAE
jgi:Gamma-glutamyl cyclotransferase, AIG2-like